MPLCRVLGPPSYRIVQSLVPWNSVNGIARMALFGAQVGRTSLSGLEMGVTKWEGLLLWISSFILVKGPRDSGEGCNGGGKVRIASQDVQ